MKITPLKNTKNRKRWIAALTVVCFTCTHFYAGNAYATTSPQQRTSSTPEIHLQNIASGIGTISDEFSGSAKEKVFLIQDAHAIPEAQKNIAEIIRRLTAQGVKFVGVEGASTKLDATFLKNFPDQKALSSVMEEYQNRGELTGANAAAIFSNVVSRESSVVSKTQDSRPKTQDLVFEGIEDWSLYEEGLGLYQEAMSSEAELQKKIEDGRKKLEAEKKTVYSKELLEIDQAMEKFYENKSDLIETLKVLAKFEAPSGELALILKKSTVHSQQSTALEIKRASKEVERLLRRPAPGGTSRNDVIAIPSWREKQSHDSRLATHDLADFQLKKQAYQTSQISLEAYALYLTELAKKLGTGPRLPDGQAHFGPVPGLLKAAEEERRLQNIQGTKLFKEFEEYAQQTFMSTVRGRQSTAEKKTTMSKPWTMDRGLWSLVEETKSLRLLSKLIKLELTREEWLEVKRLKSEKVKKLEIEKLLTFEHFNFSTHFSFYENAEEREKAFLKNLEKKHSVQGTAYSELKRSTHDASRSTIIVAGGFHTEGLATALKAKNISYAVITPKISHLPEVNFYRNQMNGDLSWKKYFKVQNGKVSVSEAFMRSSRDRLLSLQTTDHSPQKKQNNFDRGLSTVDRGHMLKNWRDEIIRSLAEQERLSEAGKYTKFIDELVSESEKENFLPQWQVKLERFKSALRNLETTGHFTQPNVLKLLTPSATTQSLPGAVLSGDFVSANIALPHRNHLASDQVPDRTEMRENNSEGLRGKSEKLPRTLNQPEKRSEMRVSPRRVTKLGDKEKVIQFLVATYEEIILRQLTKSQNSIPIAMINLNDVIGKESEVEIPYLIYRNDMETAYARIIEQIKLTNPNHSEDASLLDEPEIDIYPILYKPNQWHIAVEVISAKTLLASINRSSGILSLPLEYFAPNFRDSQSEAAQATTKFLPLFSQSLKKGGYHFSVKRISTDEGWLIHSLNIDIRIPSKPVKKFTIPYELDDFNKPMITDETVIMIPLLHRFMRAFGELMDYAKEPDTLQFKLGFDRITVLLDALYEKLPDTPPSSRSEVRGTASEELRGTSEELGAALNLKSLVRYKNIRSIFISLMLFAFWGTSTQGFTQTNPQKETSIPSPTHQTPTNPYVISNSVFGYFGAHGSLSHIKGGIDALRKEWERYLSAGGREVVFLYETILTPPTLFEELRPQNFADFNFINQDPYGYISKHREKYVVIYNQILAREESNLNSNISPAPISFGNSTDSRAAMNHFLASVRMSLFQKYPGSKLTVKLEKIPFDKWLAMMPVASQYLKSSVAFKFSPDGQINSSSWEGYRNLLPPYLRVQRERDEDFRKSVIEAEARRNPTAYISFFRGVEHLQTSEDVFAINTPNWRAESEFNFSSVRKLKQKAMSYTPLSDEEAAEYFLVDSLLNELFPLTEESVDPKVIEILSGSIERIRERGGFIKFAKIISDLKLAHISQGRFRQSEFVKMVMQMPGENLADGRRKFVNREDYDLALKAFKTKANADSELEPLFLLTLRKLSYISPEDYTKYLKKAVLRQQIRSSEKLFKELKAAFVPPSTRSEVRGTASEELRGTSEELGAALDLKSQTFNRSESRSEVRNLIPDSNELESASDAPVPLRINFSKKVINAGLSPAVMRKVVNAISRKNTTGTSERGRSLYLPLDSSEFFTFRNQTFKTVMMKMVTYQGKPPEAVAFSDGASDLIAQVQGRMTFDSTGAFIPAAKINHPKGGGFVDEAVNEYQTMLAALENGITTGLPIGVGKFENLTFEGKKLGFIIIALPEKTDVRLATKTIKEMESATDEYNRTEESTKYQNQLKQAYRQMNEHAFESGKILRALLESGGTHTHPHWDQFGLDKDGTAKHQRLMDFTNARNLATHPEMSRDEFIFRAFNDFRSLYISIYVMASQTDITRSDGLQVYREIIRYFSPDSATTPLDRFVQGFFTEEEKARLEPELLNLTREEEFIRFLRKSWNPPEMRGQKWNHINYPLVRVFADIAGPIYDRFRARSEVRGKGIQDARGKMQEEESILTSESLTGGFKKSNSTIQRFFEYLKVVFGRESGKDHLNERNFVFKSGQPSFHPSQSTLNVLHPFAKYLELAVDVFKNHFKLSFPREFAFWNVSMTHKIASFFSNAVRNLVHLLEVVNINYYETLYNNKTYEIVRSELRRPIKAQLLQIALGGLLLLFGEGCRTAMKHDAKPVAPSTKETQAISSTSEVKTPNTEKKTDPPAVDTSLKPDSVLNPPDSQLGPIFDPDNDKDDWDFFRKFLSTEEEPALQPDTTTVPDPNTSSLEPNNSPKRNTQAALTPVFIKPRTGQGPSILIPPTKSQIITDPKIIDALQLWRQYNPLRQNAAGHHSPPSLVIDATLQWLNQLASLLEPDSITLLLPDLKIIAKDYPGRLKQIERIKAKLEKLKARVNAPESTNQSGRPTSFSPQSNPLAPPDSLKKLLKMNVETIPVTITLEDLLNQLEAKLDSELNRKPESLEETNKPSLLDNIFAFTFNQLSLGLLKLAALIVGGVIVVIGILYGMYLTVRTAAQFFSWIFKKLMRGLTVLWNFLNQPLKLKFDWSRPSQTPAASPQISFVDQHHRYLMTHHAQIGGLLRIHILRTQDAMIAGEAWRLRNSRSSVNSNIQNAGNYYEGLLQFAMSLNKHIQTHRVNTNNLQAVRDFERFLSELIPVETTTRRSLDLFSEQMLKESSRPLPNTLDDKNAIRARFDLAATPIEFRFEMLTRWGVSRIRLAQEITLLADLIAADNTALSDSLHDRSRALRDIQPYLPQRSEMRIANKNPSDLGKSDGWNRTFLITEKQFFIWLILMGFVGILGSSLLQFVDRKIDQTMYQTSDTIKKFTVNHLEYLAHGMRLGFFDASAILDTNPDNLSSLYYWKPFGFTTREAETAAQLTANSLARLQQVAQDSGFSGIATTSHRMVTMIAKIAAGETPQAAFVSAQSLDPGDLMIEHLSYLAHGVEIEMIRNLDSIAALQTPNYWKGPVAPAATMLPWLNQQIKAVQERIPDFNQLPLSTQLYHLRDALKLIRGSILNPSVPPAIPSTPSNPKTTPNVIRSPQTLAARSEVRGNGKIKLEDLKGEVSVAFDGKKLKVQIGQVTAEATNIFTLVTAVNRLGLIKLTHQKAKRERDGNPDLPEAAIFEVKDGIEMFLAALNPEAEKPKSTFNPATAGPFESFRHYLLTLTEANDSPWLENFKAKIAETKRENIPELLNFQSFTTVLGNDRTLKNFLTAIQSIGSQFDINRVDSNPLKENLTEDNRLRSPLGQLLKIAIENNLANSDGSLRRSEVREIKIQDARYKMQEIPSARLEVRINSEKLRGKSEELRKTEGLRLEPNTSGSRTLNLKPETLNPTKRKGLPAHPQTHTLTSSSAATVVRTVITPESVTQKEREQASIEIVQIGAEQTIQAIDQIQTELSKKLSIEAGQQINLIKTALSKLPKNGYAVAYAPAQEQSPASVQVFGDAAVDLSGLLTTVSIPNGTRLLPSVLQKLRAAGIRPTPERFSDPRKEFASQTVAGLVGSSQAQIDSLNPASRFVPILSEETIRSSDPAIQKLVVHLQIAVALLLAHEVKAGNSELLKNPAALLKQYHLFSGFENQILGVNGRNSITVSASAVERALLAVTAQKQFSRSA